MFGRGTGRPFCHGDRACSPTNGLTCGVRGVDRNAEVVGHSSRRYRNS